jgi:GTP cyclohydrolase I
VSSSIFTSEFGGVFKNQDKKQEFIDYIKLPTEF